MKKIVVTGPESTGKTHIAAYLAKKYGGSWIPEFAREYVESLNHSYTCKDIENIAIQQIEEYKKITSGSAPLVFFDTWLIITRVWFLYFCEKVPEWVDKSLECLPVDLYLLCYPDLEWKPDPVRENGGAKRQELFNLYKKEIQSLGIPFAIIEGTGDHRYVAAENAVKKLLKS